MGQRDCTAKGCCYDSGVNAGVPWCYYDEFDLGKKKLYKNDINLTVSAFFKSYIFFFLANQYYQPVLVDSTSTISKVGMHENKIYNCVCLLFDEKSGTFLDSLRLIGPAPGLGSQKKKKKKKTAMPYSTLPCRLELATPKTSTKIPLLRQCWNLKFKFSAVPA